MECDKKHFAETHQHNNIQTPDSIPLCSDLKWSSLNQANVLTFERTINLYVLGVAFNTDLSLYFTQQVLLNKKCWIILNLALSQKDTQTAVRLNLPRKCFYLTQLCVETAQHMLNYKFVAYWPNQGLKITQHFFECMYLWDYKGV